MLDYEKLKHKTTKSLRHKEALRHLRLTMSWCLLVFVVKFSVLISLLIALCLSADARSLNSGAPVVTKVEPPSWWPNHTVNPVRLLIRGQNLSGAQVTSTNASIRISNVRINQTGTYLFVDVTIATNTRTGSYPLQLKTAQGSTKVQFRLEAPLNPATHFQGIDVNDVIYLIMTDRFANGDPKNDI